MKKVAVIIVNYNGKKYLPDLLGSIFDYEPSQATQEVIVVDNHSLDDSVYFIKQHYPQVKIFEQPENVGFAQGNNLAIAYAIKQGFDYVMLLNQDTLVTKSYLDKLISAIETDSQIAAVQPRIMLYPSTELINSLGNVIHYLGFGYTYGHKHKKFEIRNSKFEINYCSGAACLLKIEMLTEIGLFNNNLFMYHEDLDLGWRIRLKGYLSKVVPEAVVYHKYEFSRSIDKYYFMERNRFLVLFQNYKFLTILLILPALMAMEVGLLLMSFSNGWWKEKLKVYQYFLKVKNWQSLLKRRRVIQQTRLKSDREVTKNFSGKIEHQEIKNILVSLINPLFNFYWQIVKRVIIW